MKKTIFVFIFLLANSAGAFAQTNQPDRSGNQVISNQTADPLQTISQELSRISKSVQSLNKGIADWIEKMAVGQGMQLNERQQKLLLGFEILNRAEQRLEILQKFQIDLTQKEAEIKNRVAQVEEATLPDNVDRSIAFTGTTRGEEMREGRRQKLNGERQSLQSLLMQVRQNITQTNNELRQAEYLVNSLRMKILPQIESELSNL